MAVMREVLFAPVDECLYLTSNGKTYTDGSSVLFCGSFYMDS